MPHLLFVLFFALAMAAGNASIAREQFTIVTQQTPGLVHEDDAAAPGFFPEILMEMSRRSGVGLTLEFMPWKRAQEVAQSTPETLIIPLTRSPDREAVYAWPLKIMTQNLSFMSLHQPVNSIADAGKLQAVAVVAGTPFETMLRTAGLKNIEAVQDGSTAFRMLQSERVDAFFGQDLATIYAWRKLGNDDARLVLGTPISRAEMYAGANKTISTEAMEKLDDALKSIRQDGTYKRIFAKYYGTSITPQD